MVNGTVEAVNNPDVALMVPLPLAVHITVELKFPVPETTAVHWLVCPDVIDVGLQVALTDVTVIGIGVTLTMVEPLLVVSCVDVAVIGIDVLESTFGAVKAPVELIVPPPVALQVTAELKLPVPETEAVHWLV